MPILRKNSIENWVLGMGRKYFLVYPPLIAPTLSLWGVFLPPPLGPVHLGSISSQSFYRLFHQCVGVVSLDLSSPLSPPGNCFNASSYFLSFTFDWGVFDPSICEIFNLYTFHLYPVKRRFPNQALNIFITSPTYPLSEKILILFS